MQFIVPTWDGQFEEIVDKFEYICDGMGLGESLLVLLYDVVVICFLSFNDIDDNFLKIFVKSSHVYFAQLLLSFIYFLIFDDILVHQTGIRRNRFQYIQHINPFNFAVRWIPHQFQIPFYFLMHDANKINCCSLDRLLIEIDLLLQRCQDLDYQGMKIVC